MASSLTASSFLGSTQVFNTARPTQQQRTVRCRIVAERQGLWLPGVEAPEHLTKANLAGDRGFDPFLLGNEPGRLEWYAEAEKINGRWAMAAVAGIMGQELLGVTPVWYNAGLKDYAIPPLPLTAIEFLVLGFLELKRFQGFKEHKTSGFLDEYPFDPVGLNSEANQVKEIKNGRLAMVAFVGFAIQAIVTEQGPIANLQAHLSAPFQNNIIGSIQNLPNVIGKGAV
ncbi:hypothetical protein WJX74_008475 [Apatococcus lobatus]|uniref:Chlorophyll a-b binding protein, chloroplastic n=1 Tax=Apatococcus lobatus TaxID=904363 RepID=A0AAW1RAT3_9CHLO